MRKNHKKSMRDKARIEECNGFEMLDVQEYDDVDNAKNTNLFVDKINCMTEKRNRKMGKKLRERRGRI